MSESLIKLRVYKYSSTSLNGCGEELDKVMVGGKITSCLDDTLDTAEISLNGVSESEPYKPLTKFVVALEQDNQETQYFHYELRYDNVEKLSMSDNLYKHTLYLGNPAISCQKRTCDNFAISYRLKDVRLDETSYDSGYTQRLVLSNKKNVGTVARYLNKDYCFGSAQDVSSLESITQYGKYFKWLRNSYNNKKVSNNALTGLKDLNVCILYEPSGATITEETCKKIKENYSTTRCKFQIFNYDSSNQYYGDSGAYKDYFESVPNEFKGGDATFHYVVPQLCAYVSKTHDVLARETTDNISITIPGSDEYIDSADNNVVLMPTKTLVRITNLSTLEVEETTYTSEPCNTQGQVNSLDAPKYIWTYRKGFHSSALKEYGYKSTDIVLGMCEVTNSDGITSVTPVVTTTSQAQLNPTIDIPIKSGYSYEIKTTAYFGGTTNRYVYVYNSNTDKVDKVLYTGSELPSGSLMYSCYKFNDINSNSVPMLSNQVQENEYEYSFKFNVYNVNDTEPLFILKSQSTIPNCYDLFRKAQICSKVVNYNQWNTIEQNDLPYIVSNETQLKLESQNIIEDKYYNKNLWEMFMQIGKYIHAKPYIRFYQDKYELKFKDYGISEKSTKKATTNSLFSNNNIESYISSLDSYLENYFEYGNTVEEYLKPTDNDGSSVCFNDNAVLKTKYPIMEITKLQVCKKTSSTWHNITDYIYEYNIYKILCVTEKTDTSSSIAFTHFKGNSIYYHLNGTQIQGLQNTEPSKNSDKPYAIKRILGEVYDLTDTDIASLQVNDYIFKITYRTKDDVRFKTFKPDLRKFMLNASNDNYPMQSQFSNQSDKVVDSNKYGNNTYGTLLRSGNDTLDYQEYITDISQLKDSGELYDLGNQYYVAKNTMVVYPTYVECEVEYSKDYNKLSEIIGIDSSPRFYEIAEDGSIKRNISVDKFYQIGACDNDTIIPSNDLYNIRKFYNILDYKYCLVHFSGATKNYNTDTNDFSSYVLVPCIEYATGNTLTLECDMEDNFGAGENQIDKSTEYENYYMESSWLVPILKSLGVITTSKKFSGTITTRQSIQYCDVYGKADLISFAFLQELPNSYITSLPSGDNDIITYKKSASIIKGYDYTPNYAPLGTCTYDIQINKKTTLVTYLLPTIYNYTEKPIVLEKDCREIIGVNYNVHLLTDSDRFVLSNNVWSNKGNYVEYKWYFSTEEVNKMSRSTIDNVKYITSVNTINEVKIDPGSTKNQFDIIDQYGCIEIVKPTDSDFDYTQIKSIALGYRKNYKYNFIIARNVSGLTEEEMFKHWCILPKTFK